MFLGSADDVEAMVAPAAPDGLDRAHRLVRFVQLYAAAPLFAFLAVSGERTAVERVTTGFFAVAMAVSAARSMRTDP